MDFGCILSAVLGWRCLWSGGSESARWWCGEADREPLVDTVL